MKKKTPKPLKNEPKRSREIPMESQFTEDLRFQIETDRKLALRIMDLVKEFLRDPFGGIGKPERLKYFKGNTALLILGMKNLICKSESQISLRLQRFNN